MTLVPLTGGQANPRLAQSVVRQATTFQNINSPVVIESRYAIVYADGDVVAIVRGRRTFAAGSYSNITVEPIADTKVTGQSAGVLPTRVLRYFLQDNNKRVPQATFRCNTFKEAEAILVTAGTVRVIELDPNYTTRVCSVNFQIEYSVDGTTYQAPITSAYPDQYVEFVAQAGQYKKLRLTFQNDVKLYVTIGQKEQIEYVELDALIFDPAGVSADHVITPNDALPYMDGFLVSGPRELQAAPNEGWLPVEPQFRNVKEPLFLIIRGVVEYDIEDLMSRFEVTLGREEIGPTGFTRYWHVGQATWFRAADCCVNDGATANSAFIFGLDVYEPITHVRVRNTYPPYLQSNQRGRLTIHAYGVPYSSVNSRAVRSVDYPNSYTSEVRPELGL